MSKEQRKELEEFENIFGNVPFEDIKKIQRYVEERYVSKQEIRELINERQFELQQEYKDFKDDIRLNTLQEIYYLGDESNDKRTRRSNRNTKRNDKKLYRSR